MARGAAITVENNFTQGLITEFTAMNFPENAITEGDNCVFSELGFVTRRLGMNYENSFQVHSMASLTANPNTLNEFKWTSVSEDGATTFLVQQVGDKIFFFAVLSNGALSANKKTFSVDLSTFAVGGASAVTISQKLCQFASGKGFLFVVHPSCDPFYIEYTAATDSISTNRITIKIRDFEGVEDGYEIDERRTGNLAGIDAPHHYNLLNQGWYASCGVFNVTSSTPVLPRWDAVKSDLPSNADIWWTFKDSRGSFEPQITQFALTNTPAPKGHYIFDAFNIDRSTVSGVSGIPIQSSNGARPSNIVFYAGRIFYAGVNKSKFADKIYFTQIIEGPKQFGQCHQYNDPTSEEIADLLGSDGGVISLPNIDQIVTLKVIGDSLIVVGSNGTFTIGGADRGPFKATDYVVSYASTIGGVSPLSVIEVDNGLLWWNYDGIYGLTGNEVGTAFQATNVSKSTIQSILTNMPSANLQFVKGTYNKKDQIVQWLYSDQVLLTGYNYNRILELNIQSKAFYTYTIDTTLGPRISGLITLSGQRAITSLENVTDNALVQVTNNAAQNVQIEVTSFVPNSEVFKYLTTGDISSGSPGLTYSQLFDDDLVDWESFAVGTNGASYTSYGVSGYRIRGDMLRPFQSTPIEFVVRNLETGRMLVSGIWDYEFRRSSTQELYITRPEVDYILRRVKLRGKGRSLQIKFESVGNNPFNLVGWSSFDTGASLP